MQTAGLTNLIVSGKGRARKVPLVPGGVILGRQPSCEVVLESGRVSRKHARIFQDPFGRWIVEDLKSRNGVWLHDQRVEIAAVGPGDKLAIGPFTLAIEQDITGQIDAEANTHTTTSLVLEGSTSEIVTTPEQDASAVPQARMKQLNEIIDGMGELTSPSDLYPEVCGRLVSLPGSVVMVLRLPVTSQPLPASPQVLTWRFAGAPDEQDTANLHLSRRVLDGVRSTSRAVMASNVSAPDAHLDLTLVDARKPRSVFCAPVTEMAETMDVLYLDVPCDESARDMLDFVRAVARQVSATRKSLLLARARAERSVLDRQLELARKIQKGLTPAGLEHVPGVEVAVRYEPAMWVGGDYCDVWRLPDGHVAVAVGDVSGKGLPAAMVMSNLQAALRATMSFCQEPGLVMGHVNTLLERNLPEDMFVTFFLGLFDPVSGRLEYVNAGHLPPLLVDSRQQPAILGRPANKPLGIMEATFRAEAQEIPEGAGLLVVTDGITESTAPDGNQLGMDRLQAALADEDLHTAEQFVQRAVDTAVRFRQKLPQQDDVTVLALIHRNAAT